MKRQFTISRKKWLRGTNIKDGDSYLKHPKKPLFCCLGLIATQCEVPVRKLTGLCTPDEIEEYEVYLLTIHGGDYEYGTSPGCTIIIQWACKEGYIMHEEEIDL